VTTGAARGAGSRAARPAAARRGRFRGTLTDGAHVFALCGFAIAQPLFDLLGKNPTFFVAHDLGGLDVVLLALALLIVPPLALFAVLGAARLAGPAPARIARAVLAGALIAVTVLPPVERTIGFSTVVWVVAGLVGMFAAAWLYDRFVNLRTFVTFLAPAPLLFLVILLFISPASAVVLSSDPSAADVKLETTKTPVVVVVFDELSLSLLLDENGQIDATRYPGFARLAGTTTWYPNAATARSLTQYAVPAIEASSSRTDSPIPLASTYPRSLFTAFGRSHDLHVTEPVTALCPDELCANGDTASATKPSLPKDLGVVLLRTLLPDDTATTWGVPKLGDRWTGFEATPSFSSNGVTNIFEIRPLGEGGVSSALEVASFESFLESLGTGTEPGLWFEHVLLPHIPHSLLPGGYVYNQRYLPDGELDIAEDPQLAELDAQRLVLQTLRVDELVNQMLDRLESTGLIDRALLAVVADHGSAYGAGAPRRDRATSEARDALMPVPLFVKYPGQQSGRVDRRDARTIDVLPTIIDALNIDLPKAWKFEGRSLAASSRGPARPYMMDGEKVGKPDAGRAAAALAKFLFNEGDPHDPYRLGPYGALVGTSVSTLPQSAATGSVRADNAAAYDNIDLDAVIPALFEATVTGVEPGDWVAVALNGTVAGVGPIYELNGTIRVAAMLDPSLMHAGANRIDVYLIKPDGTTLHPLTAQR